MEETIVDTTLVVATGEPTIETHPIEEMLDLPEAESAVMQEQARERAREMRENFPKFLEHLTEERRDVFALYRAPYVQGIRDLLQRRNAHQISQLGIHFIPRQEPRTVYEPPEPEPDWAGPSPIEGAVRAGWQWARAYQCGFDAAAPEGDTSTSEVWTEDSNGRMVRIGRGRIELNWNQEVDPLDDFARVANGIILGAFCIPDREIQGASERIAARHDLNEVEVQFGLPTGTLSVYCMPVRQNLDVIRQYVGERPEASGEQMKAFARTLSLAHGWIGPSND